VYIYIYMELLVKPEILTFCVCVCIYVCVCVCVYIYIGYIDLRLAMQKVSCVTVVCKHFASYQGYPNYGWNLIQ
jgi:hypothetical protein